MGSFTEVKILSVNHQQRVNPVPELIIFIGIPASGKTSFFHEHFVETHYHVSLDIFRTRHREETELLAAITAGRDIVIDNTNVSEAERSRYIAPARAAGYRIIGYYFQSCLAACAARNEARNNKIPHLGMLERATQLQAPTIAEGFDELFYVKLEDGKSLISPWRQELQ